jgi:hypothetical protein
MLQQVVHIVTTVFERVLYSGDTKFSYVRSSVVMIIDQICNTHEEDDFYV